MAPDLSGVMHIATTRIVIAIAVIVAIAMRGHGLAGQFDYDGYDEGVYWQSLRAMHAGYGLYRATFCSQPPAFLLAIYPFYRAFGAGISAARAGVAVLSLLGLIGAYLLGKALSGRAGGVAALVIAIAAPAYLQASQTLEAEGPATALLFLSVGAAFTWWTHPTGRRGLLLATISGVALILGVLTKPLDITALVPIVVLICGRLGQVRQAGGFGAAAVLRPIAVACIAVAIVMLVVLLPFVGALSALMRQAVTFHLAARGTANSSDAGTIGVLRGVLIANAPLCAAAMLGAAVAVSSRDRRLIVLLAWTAATLAVLVVQRPLFARHGIVLIPPLVAISVLGSLMRDATGNALNCEAPGCGPAGSAWIPAYAGMTRGGVMGLLLLAVIVWGALSDYRYYHRLSTHAAGDEARRAARIVSDLQQQTAPDRWVITDAQFIAARADRDTPPWLADTSSVRIDSGFLEASALIRAAADARVHAVLFATGRLKSTPVAGFHSWVAQHYHLFRTYGAGTELWLR